MARLSRYCGGGDRGTELDSVGTVEVETEGQG